LYALAKGTNRRRYARGRTILQQGKEGDSLFVIVSEQARIRVL
jgi:CRP-like cAMP-binding protein